MKGEKKRLQQSGQEDLNRTAPERPVITVDYEKYEHFLEDADLSEDQKREFLQALWQIIVGFVDLGFGVHPVQQAENACGQLRENGLKAPLEAADRVKCKSKSLSKTFEDISDLETEPE